MHIASANVGRMGDRMSGSIKALQEVQCVLDERTQTLTIVQARLAESEKALETLRNAMVLRDTTMSDMDHELEALKDSGGSAFLNPPYTRTRAPCTLFQSTSDQSQPPVASLPCSLTYQSCFCTFVRFCAATQ